MTRRIVGFVLGAAIALNLSAVASAFHGGGHGGGGGGGHGGGGGGFRGGGGGGFRGGGGGYHPAGGYRPAAPAFNRTPSFSTPGGYAQPHYAAEGMHPAGVAANRGVAPRMEPGAGARPGLAGAGGLGRNEGMGARGMGPNPYARNANVNINRTAFNNANVNGPGVGSHNRYMGYHQGWYHGSWNGHGGGWRNGYGNPGYGYGGGYGGGLGYGGFGWGLGSGLGMGLGMGMGYGLSSWLFGPMLYNWGYSNYSNPYYGGGGYGGTGAVQQPIVYDYGQPIDSTAPPPDDSVATQAVSTSDQAREAFKQGDYTHALDLVDQSLRQMPNDPALHEFRALTLFALGRYDEAAAALYAVLSVGPGWDWSTMISLYGNPDDYTKQLRALETYVTQNPNSAAGHFVLAYHYLTQGHMNEASDQLKAVVALQPKDQLSAQLLQQIQQKEATPAPGNQATPPSENPPGPAPTVASNPAASNPAPTGKEGNLQGTWTAQPSKDTTITVSFQDKGHFTWKVAHQGQDHQFQGDSSYVNGILTLAQDQNNAMVGDVNWQDPDHFQFKVLGGGPSDPGLTFAKSS